MVVVTLTDCPPALRGELTEWLLEIDTGVYVGNVNARVREALWERICRNCRNGRATMTYSSNNEQRMEFKVHNAIWQPVDFDGIKLIRKPLAGGTLEPGFSKAAQQRKIASIQSAKAASKSHEPYIVVSISADRNASESYLLTEIAAIRVQTDFEEVRFHQKVQNTNWENNLPQILLSFIQFIGNLPLVCYDASGTNRVLKFALIQCSLTAPVNRYVDIRTLSKRKLDELDDFSIGAISEYVGIKVQTEDALQNCYMIKEIYNKLMQL